MDNTQNKYQNIRIQYRQNADAILATYTHNKQHTDNMQTQCRKHAHTTYRQHTDNIQTQYGRTTDKIGRQLHEVRTRQHTDTIRIQYGHNMVTTWRTDGQRTDNIQTPYEQHTGKLQITFRQHTDNIHRTYMPNMDTSTMDKIRIQ